MQSYWAFYSRTMPTLFKRIKHYCNLNNAKMLSLDKRTELGRIIADYYHQSKIKIKLRKAESVEPEGIFVVISYPKIFNPEIDKLIDNFYQKNKPTKRKRIPIKKVNPLI